MFTRRIVVLIAACFMFLGIAGLAPAEEKAAAYPNIAMDQTRDRDRLKDNTGDGVPDQIRNRDQIHDRMDTGAGSMGGGGMGSGMRGSRR
ncbi:MAG: hypothetical protein WA946_08965 [Nitrospirota bacterium]